MMVVALAESGPECQNRVPSFAKAIRETAMHDSSWCDWHDNESCSGTVFGNLWYQVLSKGKYNTKYCHIPL